MQKALKKIILLNILFFKLFRQMCTGILAFLFIRAGRINKLTVAGTFVFLVVLVVAGMFGFGFSGKSEAVSRKPERPVYFTAEEFSAAQKNNPVSASKVVNLDRNPVAYIVDGSEAQVDGISMQATAVASGKLGRQEPFNPIFGTPAAPTAGPFMPGMPGAPGSTGLSPAEEARIKAEERRNKIRDELGNSINIKGIVINANRSRPMALVEITRGDGNLETKTVVPGESIYLSDFTAKITRIDSTKICLSAEGVKVERYLPDINDDIATTTASSSSSGGSSTASGVPVLKLAPPPSPASGSSSASAPNSSAVTDAKKKIEDIDKLLDSF